MDKAREIYGAWGLGVSGWGHLLNPSGLYAVWKLGREDGIWNRPTESGSRWQLAGNFAVDREGIVRWGGPADKMEDIPDFEGVVAALEGMTEKKSKL